MQVRISETPFDPYAQLATFCAGHTDSGALASFVGYCRDRTAGRAVRALEIDHYGAFTRKEILRIVEGLAMRLNVADLLVVHRVGLIHPGEAIVLVAARDVHRENALEAVRILIDYLKTDAPFWKKEIGPDGARWIEPRESDYRRRAQAEKDIA